MTNSEVLTKNNHRPAQAQGKVTVIVPVYNQSRYLGRAIQSVLAQTYSDFEIIVVDDGSTDNSALVARNFDDRRVKYAFQNNQGLSAARNTGLRMSRGEYLTFLDSDDEFLPEKFEILINELQRHPEAGLAAGQAIPVDEDGNSLGGPFNRSLPKPEEMLLLGNPLHVGSVLLTRQWQERVGFFDDSLGSYEDWDMWLRLVYAGCKARWVEQPVSLYRFHAAQMTREGDQMTTATFAVLNKFFDQKDLEPSWRRLQPMAYSKAHLRAAAQDFSGGRYGRANAHLRQAVALNPQLMERDADPLADVFRAWIQLPKFHDPLSFLDAIYRNLGERFDELRQRRVEELSKTAKQLAFEAYEHGDLKRARYAALAAFRFNPADIGNRGLLSVFLRSFANSSSSAVTSPLG